MEIRTSNSSLTSVKTDLAIKVAILGKLERKQQEKGILKINDFDEIIHDLNFTKDSNSIKSMLKNCKVDNCSNLDLQSLKDSINIERDVYNAKNMKKLNNNSKKELNNTNSNIQEFNNSNQIKTVEDKRKQVQTIYNMLSKHEIDTDTASYLLSLHSIHPTKQFMKLAENMNLTEVKLVDFTRSLTTGEPALEQSIDQINISSSPVVAAGSMTRTAIDKFEGDPVFIPSSTAVNYKPSNVLTIGEEEIHYRTNRKMSNEKHFNASEIKHTLQHQPFIKANRNSNNNSSKVKSPLDEYIKTKKILIETRCLNDHGDCITWRQPPTKDDSHVKLRKGILKISDLETDVITWGKHHDRGIKAPESAYWDEFRNSGGFRISKGAKNISSQSDLLSFDPKGTTTTTALRRSVSAGGNTSSTRYQQRSPYPSLFYQEEKTLAGSPSKTISNIPFYTDFKTRKIISHSLHHNPSHHKPYDVDSQSLDDTTTTSTTTTTHLIFSKEANCLVHGDPSQSRTVRKHGYNNQATIHRNPIIG